MKDPRFRGLNLITYLDDASRCVTGARLFKEATSENAVVALRQTIGSLEPLQPYCQTMDRAL